MKTFTKAGLVVAGYLAAFLAALAVVAVHIAFASGPDTQGGMYAFGDSLLFLAVFGVSALPPTGAALYFLRPHRSIWRLLSATSLVIAATGFAALIDYLGAREDGTGPIFRSWSVLAVLRVLVAPLFALVFLLSGVFAPNRSTRIVLFSVAMIEASVFATIALLWFGSSRSH